MKNNGSSKEKKRNKDKKGTQSEDKSAMAELIQNKRKADEELQSTRKKLMVEKDSSKSKGERRFHGRQKDSALLEELIFKDGTYFDTQSTSEAKKLNAKNFSASAKFINYHEESESSVCLSHIHIDFLHS
jgi:hypothetical protein